MRTPPLGGHVSAAGGVYRAPENALHIGATAIQFFGASPRQWRANLLGEEDITRYKKSLEQSAVESVYLHAAYLVNLAGEGELFEKSVENLTAHFKIANSLEADGVIFHLGSSSTKKALDNLVRGIGEVLSRVRGGKTRLIMENSSGGGNKIGSSLEELSQIYKELKSKRVGFCLDTAHLFGAGISDFSPKSWRDFVKEWDKLIGIEKIEVLHINDSKASFGSNLDRHENIGQGQIGLEGFSTLSGEPHFRSIPWILEVPGFKGEGPDKKNMEILKTLFK